MKLLDYYKAASDRFYEECRTSELGTIDGYEYFPDYLNSLDNFELLELLMGSSGEDIYGGGCE